MPRKKKGKTSKLPSAIYKYWLMPPLEQDAVDAAFWAARRHYNTLIGIEIRRRRAYRELRSAMFPVLAALEVAEHELVVHLEAARKVLKAAKSRKRSRAVDPAVRVEVKTIQADLKVLRVRLREERRQVESPAALDLIDRLRALSKDDEEEAKSLREQLKEERSKTAFGRAVQVVDDEANEEVKKLRPTTYSGTYLLVEEAARAASKGKLDPRYDDAPAHLAEGRVGVHFCGGIGVDEVTSGTLMQIFPIPMFRTRPRDGKQHARGKAARTTLKFRIGSEGTRRSPVWATFPMVMDRPLPADARIKDAYVTRRPHDVRTPWRYELCVVVEAASLHSSHATVEQTGTTSVNFGWRKLDGGDLRVAMVSSPRGVEEVRLPARVVNGFEKCSALQGTLSTNFDAVKVELAAWVAKHASSLPEAFLHELETMPKWKSQHRLAEVVWYWREHRLPGDEEIWSRLSNPMPKGEDPKSWPHGWLDRYRHLQCWVDNERRYLLDFRLDFYRREAKRICTSTACVVVDTFKISDVARRSLPEEVETGGQDARTNRVIAAPSILRREILRAAAKWHCTVEVAKTENGTRRCNVCGVLAGAAVRKLVHACASCGAVWDQDVNNTDNLDEAHASGEVVTIVRPAEVAEDGRIVGGKTTSFGVAREAVSKLLKTE